MGIPFAVLLMCFAFAFSSPHATGVKRDMGLMTLVNLVAIGLLSGVAFKLLKDYSQQRKAGLDPVFTRARMPEVTGIQCWEDELSVTGPIDLPVKRR